MQRLKKVLSLLLCCAMLFGVIPFGALAAENETKTVIDAAVIFSDLHTRQKDYKQTTVEGIMNAVKQLPISSVTCAGDAFSSNETAYTGKTDTITGYIRNVLGSDMPVNYVWSDHDRGASMSKDSGLVYGAGDDGVYGTADDGNYYIYSLSMADLSTNDRYNAGFHTDAEVTAAIAAFKTAAEGLDHTKPLFIASHMPLFERRNDNGHAEEWFDAINEVAGYMDVAYFFGHNHSYDVSGDYYAAKGSEMTVETMSGTGVEKTLNFTHLCAGYLDPSSTGSTSNTTRQGTAVAISIYDDSISYTTYNASGVYTGNYAVNETVTRAFAGKTGTPGASEGGEKSIYVPVDRLDKGEKYLIVDANKQCALKNNEGKMGSAAVTPVSATVTVGDAVYSEYIDLSDSTVVWTAEELAAPGIFNLKNGEDHISYNGLAGPGSVCAWQYDSEAKQLYYTIQSPVKLYLGLDANGNWGTTVQKSVYLYKQVTGAVIDGESGDEDNTVNGGENGGEDSTVTGINNYPEYPDEGAVKVSKTGTGIDFQSSGIAQVEISASGVPMSRGVDIIVMLDMSSSMDRCIECDGYTGKYSSKGASHTSTCKSKNNAVARVDELRDAMKELKDVLVAAPGADDIKIAVADFNGRYTSTSSPYYLDPNDRTQDKACLDGNSQARVLTGTGLNADAFINPANMDVESYFSTANGKIAHTGTNYDYAFDAIYQLGHAIKEANGENQRDLYVLFMSDGAPNQFNYYGTTGGSGGTTDWNYWLTGNVGSGTGKQSMSDTVSCSTHSYYYDTNDYDGDGIVNEHRMANAIKGDTDQSYQVVRKATTGLSSVLTSAGKTNLYNLPGLGATMYSVAFYVSNDGNITEASAKHALQQVASSSEMYFDASKAGVLSQAFGSIASDILYAAYNARFVDQMGDDYNLQMKTSTYSVVNGSSTTSKKVEPKIEIISYDIYTRQNYLDGLCNESQIGDRKGTYTVQETVTFSADGTKAYSDKIGAGVNILGDDGVIRAKSFFYNTNTSPVTIEGISIPTGTNPNGTTSGSSNVLPAETFYWNMGTVTTSELAMRYYVYLTGSMEGTREAGSYPTNEYATLYYDNYAGNPCKKETVSPVLPWKEANVSYAFYLVNEAGQIIVNQTTGQTGSFANKIAVTNPVVYDTVLLNTSEEIDAVEAAAVLPEGYTLFDATYDANGNLTEGATYTVTVNSNTTGSWVIDPVKDNVPTTYVMHYDTENASAYSKELNVNEVGYDYTHTVVWFAVVWKVQALPDTVVIDYGLPVDISVLTNDMFGENGKLAGVGELTEGFNLDGVTIQLANGFGEPYKSDYGTAAANASTGKVRYTPKNMQMNSYDKFAYAVNYTGATNPGYYYDTVTVIPATTIYYEDDFLTYSVLDSATKNQKEGVTWDYEGTRVQGATQAEDRPGQYSLTDANNIYGYDSVNMGMSTHSLGQARKVHVDANTYAKAEFSFWGTGFDVISMTNSNTGLLAVQVYNQNGTQVRATMVNTYYGYEVKHCYVKYESKLEWVQTEKTYFQGEPTKEGYTADLTNLPDVTKKGDVIKGWMVENNIRYYVTYECKSYWAETECTEFTGDPVKEGYTTQITGLPKDPEPGQTVQGWKTISTITNSKDAIYQVPVIQVENLEYGKYDVVITASYASFFDQNESVDGYDLYLDAIRIYNPANEGVISDPTSFDRDTTIQDAYKADGEAWPTYYELRDKIIAAATFGNNDTNTKVEGMVFIDGNDGLSSAFISDYISYGPNNEVYLAKNQSVAFTLNADRNVANVHIGVKSADGKTGTYTIKNIAQSNNIETGVKAGTVYNEKNFTVDTATDMYYDLGSWKSDIIVITNTGDSVISLTNIKTTHTQADNSNSKSAVAPAAETDEEIEVEAPVIYMTRSAAVLTVQALTGVEEEVTPEEPEVNEPETEPETKPGKPGKPEKETKPKEDPKKDPKPKEDPKKDPKPKEDPKKDPKPKAPGKKG